MAGARQICALAALLSVCALRPPMSRGYDPFKVLNLDPEALRSLNDQGRHRAVRKAYRTAALATHPDTSDAERGDRFQLVQQAADELRDARVLEEYLARYEAKRSDILGDLWRDEVREWSVARVGRYLRDAGLSEAVVAEFAANDVDGREVVGLDHFGGADTDHFLYALRWIGADEDEATAARTEAVLRGLIQREYSENFMKMKWTGRRRRY
mmetsp:Transcript_15439/g.46105  ORF Transcript_15439/g.46105 Transcript_15439/m.46105 type:complete len:212 (-) Transcript_15439:17-652(-)